MTSEAARPSPIRVTVLGLMRRADGRILVERGQDSHAGHVFYRALGGGVESGEYAADALAREFGEELALAVTVGPQRAVIENIFVYEGLPCHEIVFIHDVAPQDAAFFALDTPLRIDGGQSHVCWRSVAEIAAEGAPLYPPGFAALATT